MDNWATASWPRKRSSTSSKDRAYLLRLSTFHQGHYCYLHISLYVSGPANYMANDCSRFFQLSDSQLLAYFNSTYPQNEWWKIHRLRTEMNSTLISLLQCKRKLLQEIITRLKIATTRGKHGKNFLQCLIYLSFYATLTTPSLFSKSSPTGTGMVGYPVVVQRTGLEWWKKPYVHWGAIVSYWVPRTLV